MTGGAIRLDMQPAFQDLEAALQDLDRLASVAETVKDDALRRADPSLVQACIGSKTYVPIVMTETQMENLCFIIGRVSDAASRAWRRYGEAVESSLADRR